jgi:hypothetical protein
MPQLVVPYKFILGSVASAEQMNANFLAVANFYNGNLSGDNLEDVAIDNTLIDAGTIIGDNLADDAIDNSELAALTITSDNIANDVITGNILWPQNGDLGLKAYRVPLANTVFPAVIPGTVTSITVPASPGTSGDRTYYSGWHTYSTVFDNYNEDLPTIPLLIWIAIIPDDITDSAWTNASWVPSIRNLTADSFRFILQGNATGTSWTSAGCSIDLWLMYYDQSLSGEL